MNPDFSDMLSALFGEDAEFLVVGAYALAVHGIPRATGDIDLWIRPTAENAERVLRGLRRFGAPLHDLKSEDLSKPGIVFQVGVAPRRIDLLTAIDGVTFEEAWASRVTVDMGEIRLPVLGRAELKRNKRASGRAQDLTDVEQLERLESSGG